MPSGERQGLLERAEAAGRAIETALLVVLLLGMIALAAVEIVLRNVFSTGLFWADDLLRLSIVWLAVIGAVAATRDERHLAINLVSRYCPESWHRPAGLVASLFAAAVSATVAWHSFRFVADTYAYDDRVLGDLPAWVFQIILPIGFTLISYRFLLRVLGQLRGLRWR